MKSLNPNLVFALALSALSASTVSLASESVSLKCSPTGWDGTPEIHAVIRSESILDAVVETYIFEQGAMEPSKLGRVVGEDLRSGYSTRLFVLNRFKNSVEELILPRSFAEFSPGTRFEGLFEERDLSKGSVSHRTLRCRINVTRH